MWGLNKMNCNNKLIANWCNNKNVKTVQMKSVRTPYDSGRGNVYKGEIVKMCEKCRKSNNGQFKILK